MSRELTAAEKRDNMAASMLGQLVSSMPEYILEDTNGEFLGISEDEFGQLTSKEVFAKSLVKMSYLVADEFLKEKQRQADLRGEAY